MPVSRLLFPKTEEYLRLTNVTSSIFKHIFFKHTFSLTYRLHYQAYTSAVNTQPPSTDHNKARALLKNSKVQLHERIFQYSNTE